MTLVEMMVAVARGTLIPVVASSRYRFGSNSFVAMGNNLDL